MCSADGSNNSSWTSWQYFTTTNTNRILSQNNNLIDLNVFPNPTENIVNISFISEEINDYHITLADAYGKLIFEDHKKEFIGEYVNKIDLGQYSPGVYIFKIKTKSRTTHKKVVLQR